MKRQIAGLCALAFLAACAATPNPNVTTSTTPSSLEDTEAAVGTRSAGGTVVAAPASAPRSGNVTTAVAVGNNGIGVGASSNGTVRVGTRTGARHAGAWW